MAKYQDTFDSTEVVELRIHGVSNTPPASMLDIDPEQLQQVAGDEDTLIFRAEPEVSHKRRVRAYSWGNLTQGRNLALKNLQRALWMLLLPFAFANVALWTRQRPPETSETASRTDGLSAFWLRLFALSLTITFTLAVVGVALDQVVWQWMNPASTGNAADVGWLAFLRDSGVHDTSRSLTLGGAAAAAVMLIVWAVARRSFQYEAETGLVSTPAEGTELWDLASPDSPHSPFESRWFWRGNVQVSHLSRTHLTAVLSVITLATALPLVLPGDFDASGADRALYSLVCIVAVLTLMGAVVCLFLPVATRREANAWGGHVSAALVGVAAANTVMTLFCLSVWRVDVTPEGGLPWYAETVLWLSVFQVVVLLGLWVWSPKVQHARAAWKGRGAAVLATTGWFLALLYGATLLYYTADFLNGAGNPAGQDQSIVLPSALQVAAACVAPVLVALVLVAGSALLRIGTYTKTRYAELMAQEPTPPRTHRARRAHDVAKAQGLHDFLERDAVSWLGAIVFGGFLLSLGAAGYAVLQADGAEGASLEPGGVIPGLTGIGGRLLLLLAIALAFVAAQVYSGGTLRRVIGIVWDVATFWPRACHPWAPPSYAERCVPQLATYVGNRDAASSPGFILAGHSQGSVLAVATLWQLPRANRDRCALLTFGTQLRAFYGRTFPAFFDQEQLERLAGALTPGAGADSGNSPPPRWRSLWRPTDPIGYPVLDRDGADDDASGPLAPVDHGPVKDPDSLSPPVNDYIDPRIWGHTDYWVEADYEAEAELLAAALRSPAGAP